MINQNNVGVDYIEGTVSNTDVSTVTVTSSMVMSQPLGSAGNAQ